MYVGVIRGDLPGPLFLSDVEPTSQHNNPVDPVGQTQYVEYPQPAVITNYLSGLSPDGLSNGLGGVPAGIESSAAVTFPLTLTGSNNVLRVKNTSAGSFASHTITAATYATMTTLLVAVNSALSGSGVSATTDSTGTLLVLQSTVVGVGSYVAVDTVGDGSTFNTPANLISAAPSTSFTMPTAASIITAMSPVGGPLNVSAAKVLTTLGASPKTSGVVGLIAKHLVETEVVIQSYQVGALSKLLEGNFSPDPNRKPALALGAAITVVEDDGTTVYSSSASAPLPTITGAAHNTPNAGDLTISGSGLGNSEFYNATHVIVSNPVTGATVHIDQKLIVHTVSGGTTGSVSATSIVIPASLLAGLGVAGNRVSLRFSSLPNSVSGAAASITTYVNGIATLTGLTGMTAASVGSFVKLTNCSNFNNNGTFRVMAYHSATSVDVGIPNGVGTDGHNGSIVWVNSPVTFTTT